jgi:hypothetical protein
MSNKLTRAINTLSDANIPLQSSRVPTDEIELKPFLDFEDYVQTIVSMIKDSHSNFSIGVHGVGNYQDNTNRSIEDAIKSKKNNLIILLYVS